MFVFSPRAIVTSLALMAAYPISALAADAPPPTPPAAAPAGPAVSDAERGKIEAVVHDYLLKHPDVIIEAVEAYQANAEAEKEKAAKDALPAHAKELLHDPATQVMGNVNSDCAIVEFFDNQCPFCQANEPELQKLLKQDGRVKLVLKEFPILGPVSLVASKAALASVKQGKYDQFHEALLGHKGHYPNAALVDEIAKSVGLDLDKLHKDMDSPEIMAELDQNIDLGRTLNITGTPGFIVGDQIISGLSKVDELKKFVDTACKSKG
jgi:protein-disulfide isomerase